MDADERWQAVLARSWAHDGRFYYALLSTGVYCRPSCPARRPGRDRVRFFDSALLRHEGAAMLDDER